MRPPPIPPMLRGPPGYPPMRHRGPPPPHMSPHMGMIHYPSQDPTRMGATGPQDSSSSSSSSTTTENKSKSESSDT